MNTSLDLKLALSQRLEAAVYTAEKRQEITWLKGTGIW
jgi:hypothetical protein